MIAAANQCETRACGAAGDVGLELLAELLGRGHDLVMRARGLSMSPLFRDGDLLTLGPLETLRAGEVIAALRDGQLFIHRVVRLGPRGALLRGDSRGADDGWFSQDELIGRVLAQRRGHARLGAWRLGGARARVWLALLPALRFVRAVRFHLRRSLAIRSQRQA